MALKDAVVIVLDVGPTVVVKSSKIDGTTFMAQSLKCISKILQRKIFAESKDEVALVLSGTVESDNSLASTASTEYGHISVAREMGPVSWSFMEMVDENIKPGLASADLIDALVVAMDHMTRWTTRGRAKYSSRQIYLMSDLRGDISTDQVDVIVRALRNSGIQLNVIGPDLQLLHTSAGEVIAGILDQVDGASFSFSEVIPALSFFKRKSVRSMPWKAPLEIGPKLSIPVCCYLKVKRPSTKSWKKSYANDEYSKIIVERSYHKNDELQEALDKSDTIEAHRYGRTLVPFSEEDRVNMNYQSGSKSFAVLGFTKQTNVKRHLLTGDSVHYVVADSSYMNNVTALSAIINALHETDMVAIVRYVYSARSGPKIGVLTPHIKANYECLVFIKLPFAEDLRTYGFASLDFNPKNKPTDDQLGVIDELIDAMDLTRPQERFKPKQMLNPSVQRLYQCLLHRGMNPGTPMPEVDPELMRSFSPEDEMLEVCEPISKKMRKLFPLEKAETKDKKTAVDFFKNPAAVKDDDMKVPKMEVDDFTGIGDFVRNVVTEVGTVNPVKDFREIIRANQGDLIEACRQMKKVVMELIMDSVGDLQCQENYKKALASLTALREESLRAPSDFNSFLRDLKESLLSKSKDVFWRQMSTGKIGLITADECAMSDVTEADALAFFEDMDAIKITSQSEVPDQSEDVEDLLDLM